MKYAFNNTNHLIAVKNNVQRISLPYVWNTDATL